ncbi:MAG: hypothetical protein MUO89_05100 [Dehalococcoidia bacterium]|nr:hypothetical protein [Dehalococcoidia bacterium]
MPKTGPTRRVTRSKAPTRRVRRVIEEEPEEVEVVRVKHGGTKWLGASPWVVIIGVIALLFILFVPMFSATKTVQKTETVMVPVQKERQEQVTADETINVYTGWLQEGGGTIQQTGYYVEYDSWGNPYYVPYTYYDQAAGSMTTIDPVDQIVQMQQTRGPDNTWTITLTSYDGTQVIHRDVTSYDLTKTGRTTVKANKTVSTPYTEMVPQQVTKDVETKVRVSLINLMLGNY